METEWYYIEAGNPVGPLSQEAFLNRLKEGKIADDTLVWKPGMTEWIPFSGIAYETASLSGGAPNGKEESSRIVKCPTCGNPVASEALVKMGETEVCPTCRMRLTGTGGAFEGAGRPEFGGFLIRSTAISIDGIFLLIIYGGLFLLAGYFLFDQSTRGPIDLRHSGLLLQLTIWIPNLLFEIVFVALFQATPGKMAVGLKIVTGRMERLSLGKVIARAVVKILVSGFLTLGLGYLPAAFGKEKRALHDFVCDTRVIKRL